MNVELRMWNFELVALRAMKNYLIKNYLASYSMFILESNLTLNNSTLPAGQLIACLPSGTASYAVLIPNS